jgi:hypothetical protein
MMRGAVKEQFAAAIARLLRPIVRQLIAQGITYPAFCRMVKQIYLDVAQREFPLSFKRQTDSRLALMTGLNRKEIARLRELRATDQPGLAVEDTLVTHVIGRWMAGPPFADADGTPKRLAYESARPNVPSFARLVRELGADIPVRSVLDELLRIGLVELMPDGDVRLLREAHIPAQDVPRKLTLLGSDPAELFTTIVHNIEHPESPRLQRKVVYDNIGAQALTELRVAAARLGEQFIRRANALLASYDRDRNAAAPGGKRTRVVLGAYYFDEDTPPADGKAKAPSSPPGRIKRSR